LPHAEGAGHDQVTHLIIGQIVAPRGIRGELKVRIETQDPNRFFDLETVYLGEEMVPFGVQRARLFKKQALLQLDGIDDRNTAELWRGAFVYVDIEQAIVLEEGEYYTFEIEGLAVTTDEGEDLGEVTDVITTGANDVYVVRGPSGEILLPAIADVILDIDLENGHMLVHVPEGLR
jgi:16S rRNA processing protein RimM